LVHAAELGRDSGDEVDLEGRGPRDADQRFAPAWEVVEPAAEVSGGVDHHEQSGVQP
jgi:hypothetical protein